MEQFNFSFKPYSRTLAKTLKMSRGEISVRDGIIVRLENSEGSIFYGEAVTLPYFGTETKNQSIELLEALPRSINQQLVREISPQYSASRFALESALLGYVSAASTYNPRTSRAVSFLLSSEGDICQRMSEALAHKYSTFKLKIGINPFDQELKLIHVLLKIMPPDCSLRLDANGGLTLEAARAWCKECEGREQIEFIEQPLAPELVKESVALLSQTKTTLALDESVATTADLARCLQQGWTGIIVVKVSRLGDLAGFLELRNQYALDIVYSSALETSVGTELGIKIALLDQKNTRALGYGVSHWFEDDGLYLHEKGAELSPLSKPEQQLSDIWNRL